MYSTNIQNNLNIVDDNSTCTMHSESFIEKNQIILQIRTLLPELLKLGIKKIGIFGSVMRGDTTRESDVDILIEFQPGKKNYQNLIKAKDILEAELKRKVDLVQIDGLSKFIGPKILQEVEYIEDHS